MATKFKDSSRFLDSMGVIGARGKGYWKVLHAGPSLCGVPSSPVRTMYGVGGKRAGYALLANSTGVYGGGGGGCRRLHPLVLAPRRGRGHFDIKEIWCRGQAFA